MYNLEKLNKIQTLIGYQFTNIKYLVLALTHSSTTNPENNQRLEFLGDAVLALVVSQWGYLAHPQLPEGKLHQMRTKLVCTETLASVAASLELHTVLETHHQKVNQAILADTLEAVIGAIFLDADFTITQSVVLKFFANLPLRWSELSETTDSKTILKEWAEEHQLGKIIYRTFSMSGKPHDPLFTIECLLPNTPEKFYGKGKSRKIAERNAAQKALAYLALK
ncbi:MAG: ribonuclease III [Gammaproteobacteria bacterium]|nr:ribonuclease III [Gammaproteobacteria bacterium]